MSGYGHIGYEGWHDELDFFDKNTQEKATTKAMSPLKSS
jgi:hypothetical protein